MVRNVPPSYAHGHGLVRPEWQPSSSQRARKRRDSKVAYLNNTKQYRNGTVRSFSPSSPYGNWSPLPQAHDHSSASPNHPVKPEFEEFFDFCGSSMECFDSFHQISQAEPTWNQSSTSLYTLPTRSPSYSQDANARVPVSNHGLPSQMPTGNVQAPLQNGAVSGSGGYNNLHSIPSGDQFGSYRISNNAGLPGSTASPDLDNFTQPFSFELLESPGQIQTAPFPGGAIQTRQPSSESSPTSLVAPHSLDYPNELSEGSYCDLGGWTTGNPSLTENMQQWPTSAATELAPGQQNFGQYTYIPSLPHAMQFLRNGDFSIGTYITNVTLQLPPEPASSAYPQTKSEYQPQMPTAWIPEAVSPTQDSESEWLVVSSHPSSSVHSHESVHSEVSPPSTHVNTPPSSSASPPSRVESHSHIFSAHPGISSAKINRGRQRALTSQEKKEALDVRKAKACWACHLSKIKCSPCSPGSPCQQCERLSGKRRFCWLPCFNDPLESLGTFLAPDYIYSGYAPGQVEWFVNRNVTRWGVHEIPVEMNWGYWKPIRTNVVIVQPSEESEIIFVHQSVTNFGAGSQHFRKRSPPLGVPPASVHGMHEQYPSLVQNIIMDKQIEYCEIAYNGQESELPERLLLAITSLYVSHSASGNEWESLRQALEVHVTTTILVKSFVLEDHSLRLVEEHLQQKYPPRTTTRLAQKQLKLGFYKLQQKLIPKVLESWGSMMWTSNKNTAIDLKWSVSFGVLLSIILVTDKILFSAYRHGENRIRNYGAEPTSKRAGFRKLVRLCQTELFERCKEIFHSSFKTRKGGKEACNPIRDGIAAFRGRPVSTGIAAFINEIQAIMREFGPNIKSHRSSKADDIPQGAPYTNQGRLASIFLADFLDH